MSLLVPLVVFVALVVGQEPVRRAALGRAGRWSSTKRAWRGWRTAGRGRESPGSGFSTRRIPTRRTSISLAGVRSSERLCTARTRAGEETLAAWLMHPANADEVRERQDAVGELHGRLDLREEIELLGSDLRAGTDPDALAAWGSEPRAFTSGRVTIAVTAAVLSVLAVAAIIGWGLFETGLSPFCLVALAEIAVAAWTARRVRRVLAGLDERTHDLLILSALLARLEHESFGDPGGSAGFARLWSILRAPASRRMREAGAAAPLAQLPPEPVLHADRSGPALVVAVGACYRRLARSFGAGDRELARRRR